MLQPLERDTFVLHHFFKICCVEYFKILSSHFYIQTHAR